MLQTTSELQQILKFRFWGNENVQSSLLVQLIVNWR